MLRFEGRKLDGLAPLRRHARPVVGQRDLGAVVANGLEVVPPDPSAEVQRGVVRILVTRNMPGLRSGLPRDCPRRLEYLDPVRHFVVLVGVVVVVHPHHERSGRFRSKACRRRDSRTQPVPSIASCVVGSANTANTVSTGALTVVLALIVSLVIAIQTAKPPNTHRNCGQIVVRRQITISPQSRGGRPGTHRYSPSTSGRSATESMTWLGCIANSSAAHRSRVS